MGDLHRIHESILTLQKRADKINESVLLQTFVQAGPLLPSLMSENNQILFGRRGTGKTHFLQIIKIKKSNDSIVVYIDTRTLGSSGSLYNDSSLPLPQRAISLFKDVLDVLYNGIWDYVSKNSENYTQQFSDILDNLDLFEKSYTKLVINGGITEEVESRTTAKHDDSFQLGLEGKSFKASLAGLDTSESSSIQNIQRQGAQEHYVNYNAVFHILSDLLSLINVKLWVLIDEFSELPVELQILLADMIKHVFCPNKNIIVKIAAIETRTSLIKTTSYNYEGLEVGADIFSENLDDIMVFGNNQSKALEFFRNLLFNHINYALDEANRFSDTNVMIQTLFTQENVFNELVDAAEGVPRDAISILGEAIHANFCERISMPGIRNAARNWYERDKYNSVAQYPDASALLNWIISSVIGQRRAKAFLLSVGSKSQLIDHLFDSRILHILKQNVSTKDRPGERFNVYSIDYGCYVELIQTDQKVLGLFQEEDDDSAEYIQVPKNDYRSIRRAILDLNEFFRSRQ